jgi:hypothetical protein
MRVVGVKVVGKNWIIISVENFEVSIDQVVMYYYDPSYMVKYAFH